MIRGLAIPICLLLGRPAVAAPPLDCSPCHRTLVDTFDRTAHARASSPANAQTVQGPFDAELPTSAKGVYFRMERRKGRFYQTGIQPGGRTQTEQFDLVIGSGRRGQSYLYWRDGLLYQLPVSYHVASRRWINSPGYEDGVVNFGRGIPPQCLACHASGFRLEPAAAKAEAPPRYAAGYSLGIGCVNCHGEVERHEQLRRPSSLDLCARCHSGLAEEPHQTPDVHGNQVGLLKSSRCFQRSGGAMTCGTCHDVHRMERDPVALSAKCGICHQPAACSRPASAATGNQSSCVECHMPLTASKLIQVQSYRTHRIATYRR